MTILVTGGAGFIGSNFIHFWLSNFDEPIVNLDLLTYAGNLQNLMSVRDDSRYYFVKGSINDSEKISKLYIDYTPRAIVNFAAESHVDRSIHGPADFVKTNINGVFNLLDTTLIYWNKIAQKAKADFKFVHISTDEVYGSLSINEPSFTEISQYAPNSPYAASKASSDHLVRSYFKTFSLPVITTNCSNNYGPYQFPEKLIPLIISNALSGKKLPIYGDGKQIRDWLYVSDHCEAISLVLENGRIGETYNIGGSSEKTNLEVVDLVCRHLDERVPLSNGKSYSEQIEFVSDRLGHDRRYAINSDKIRGELGWKPVENFESGLVKTVNWYLDNQSWLDDVVSGKYRD